MGKLGISMKSACLLFFSMLSLWGADYLIITSSESALSALPKYQLRQIYLGKLDTVEGEKIQPIQLKTDDPLRKLFEAELFAPGFDLQAYWFAEKIRNGARPPLTLSSWALVLAYVERNPGMIGYIEADKREKLTPYKVKVVEVR